MNSPAVSRTRFNQYLHCLRVFAAHYKQAPLQAGAIVVGVVLAVTLLTGVKAINDNAVKSYSSATELLSQQASWFITPLSGRETFSEDLYFDLRSAGYSQSLAVIEETLVDELGNRLQVTGSDLIAALMAFSSSKGEQDDKSGASLFDGDLPVVDMLAGKPVALMNKGKALRYANETLVLAGEKVKVVGLDQSLNIGSRVLMDISLLQRLLNRSGEISYIALFDDISSEQQSLNALIAGRALLSQSDNGENLSALTESFHLNLTAMSMLAFIVGLFIAYNGIRYSLMKRQRLLTQLQQLGMPKLMIISALITELVALVIAGSFIGFAAGLQLSYWLHPMVSVTLEQLYDARILAGSWSWIWLLQAVGLTLFSSLLACSSLFIQFWRQPLARTSGQYHQQKNAQRIHTIQLLVALCFAAVAVVAMPFSQDYRKTMLLLGFVVVAIPLALPWSLSMLVNLMARFAPKGLVGYQAEETKELVPPMSLAMMAMLLAVTANISMNTLVGSFEITLKNWLEGRLHADIYVRPPQSQMIETEQFLRQQPEVTDVFAQYFIKSSHQNMPVYLVTKDIPTFEQTTIFKNSLADIWPDCFAGKLVLLNEPMAVKLGIQTGDAITLEAIPDNSFTVGGVFYDYGNPSGEVLIAPDVWQENRFTDIPLSLGADYSGTPDELRAVLRNELGISDALIFDQSQIRERAITIFTRTFAITGVLNTLTLLVAAIGLFSACYLMTQARTAPIARLYSLGVSRKQLTLMVVTQMLVIVLLTCLVALPTGAMLGYLLINKVTLQAFGWSIAMVWSWQAYAEVVGLALFASGVAVAYPLYRQTRRPLVSSLQSEVI
ncbi:ABC transporter permease [Vibrio sp. JC009]|uniref:ABC transporter permease n=1 Tax=Vibrio sp. JC009 TaxID=2912314 RepID=UPI0023B08A72|nr:ABC transporter permease [Vibrio sp. JC009]WED22892.1 ABC transporter permease [Vibrio sp. JC009]